MQQNKTVAKLLPGVYELSCDYRRKYIGEAKKKNQRLPPQTKRVLTRSIKHQEDNMTGKWKALGAAAHPKDCHGRFNWPHPKTLAHTNITHKRKIRESLEINNLI